MATPNRRAPRAAGTVAGLGALALAYGVGVERRAYTLRRVTVPALAPGTPGALRVLHISDVHMTAAQTGKQAWLADLARLAPDLVVSTGDGLASADGVPALLDALAPLTATPGVFVLGSNDYFAPRPKNPAKYFFRHHRRIHGALLPWRDMVDGLTDAGWTDINNRRRTLRIAGRSVEVRGVDDPHLRGDRLDLVSGAGEPSAVLRLGVVHAPEPRVLDAFVADGVNLVLCGHTHGGQLRVPGFGALVTNCGIDRARARGMSCYGSGGRWARLHVSAGLGTSPYAPVRFACRPEATLLTLVARPGRAEGDTGPRGAGAGRPLD